MARQKLGQHFLASGKILEKIAVAACGTGVHLAVEIGPGRGALTEHLLAHAERVVAIELDSELVQVLRERWRDNSRLEILQADALRADFTGQLFTSAGTGVLTGNLPYYAATAMISQYLRTPGPLRRGVFLVQKEVAERIAAQPGTRDYGYLSVECQFFAETEYLFSVPPGAFQPPPKVESAVIRVTPRIRSGETDPAGFLAFASACFRQKRKTLRNNLLGIYSREILGAQQPQMEMRAEKLTVDALIRLYRELELAHAS